MTRGCGACTACCTAYVVHGVPGEKSPKPAGRPCIHATHHTCGIYESRPRECIDYVCSWLLGERPEEERPDKLGLIVDYRAAPIPGYYIQEVRDVLANPVGRARRVLARVKEDMYQRRGPRAEVVTVCRFDGSQVAYLPDGRVQSGPGRDLVQLRKKP